MVLGREGPEKALRCGPDAEMRSLGQADSAASREEGRLAWVLKSAVCYHLEVEKPTVPGPLRRMGNVNDML